jgi:aryl-alcohol dehydrogenase-like predicted oxidoreductase
MHHIDRDTPWEEIWQAMDLLVQQGKVIYIGSSNFAGWHIATANQTAARRNFLGLVSEQSIYNLRNRHIELEVVPACRAYGLGLIPWSPLAGGVLGGILEKQDGGRRSEELAQRMLNRQRAQLERYESLCKQIGEKPADVAMAWLLHNPDVTSPIIGPRTLEQLRGTMRSLEIKLEKATLEKLDEIWPGPGGEAPEAYAW